MLTVDDGHVGLAALLDRHVDWAQTMFHAPSAEGMICMMHQLYTMHRLAPMRFPAGTPVVLTGGVPLHRRLTGVWSFKYLSRHYTGPPVWRPYRFCVWHMQLYNSQSYD